VTTDPAAPAGPYGPTGDDQPFWDAAQAGTLLFQRCDDCRYVRWPAAGVCPECLSRAATWAPVEGAGTLWSHVVYHRAYAPKWKDEIPYPVGLVRLDCGVRLVTRLVDLPPGGAEVGMRVTVRFRELGDRGVVPVFGP
jgi:uncharacterized OB-fold protein